MHISTAAPKWCTETGRAKVLEMLERTERTGFNSGSKVIAAMAMFDAGLFIPLGPPLGAQRVTVSGEQCKLARYLFGGDCVNRPASCWEATNLTSGNILLQSNWSGDDGVRQWALIGPGQVMRFDNRGGGDPVWCVNCPQVDHTYVDDERGTRWGYWPGSVDLWRKWTGGSLAEGCYDHLGLGPTH